MWNWKIDERNRIIIVRSQNFHTIYRKHKIWIRMRIKWNQNFHCEGREQMYRKNKISSVSRAVLFLYNYVLFVWLQIFKTLNARNMIIIISGTENLCVSGKDKDFPGGPVVKNLPSNVGMQVWFFIREPRFHMLQGN